MLDEKGYTLIEIIAAVMLLSITVLPLSTLFIKSMHSIASSKELLVATALGQEKIEELKSLSFGQLKARQGTHIEEDIKSNDFYFNRTVTIEMEDVNLLKIIVKVQGINEVVDIVTYRGDF